MSRSSFSAQIRGNQYQAGKPTLLELGIDKAPLWLVVYAIVIYSFTLYVMTAGYKFLPFPYTQRITAPIPCDEGLLLFELSASMYSSWAVSFDQYIKLSEHSFLLSGFLHILQRSIDIGQDVVLETVVDKVDFWDINGGNISPHVQPRSYRLWVPLSGPTAASFVTEMHASLTEQPAPKRRKTDVVSEPCHPLESRIQTREHFVSMIRIYFGARTMISAISIDDAGDDRAENHILNLLDAKRYLNNASVSEKHIKQRLDDTQRCIDYYIRYGTNEAASFYPADKINDAMLCRLITVGPSGLLKKATDILNFMLPHYIPSQRLVLSKLRVVLDSIGESWDPSYDNLPIKELIKAAPSGSACFTDPIDYSPIEVSASEHPDGLTTFTAAQIQLEEAYPVSFRLKRKNLARLEGAKQVGPGEVLRVYENIVHESRTLLSTYVSGVPKVYHDLLKESTDQLLMMQNPSPAQKMFYQKSPPGNYTGFGYRLLRLLMGASNCLRLMEQQSMLFLLLFSRHFTTTANRSGIGGGLTIVCGPPDTGKSRACEQFLSSVCKPLHVQNDGQSAKAYTADDKATDLRCMYQDEIKELLVSGEASDAASSAAIKVQQTLLSRGYIRYRRLYQTDTGKYDTEDILIVQRVMLVGCTNAVSSIPPAIQSRSCIVPLVKQPKDLRRRVSVNALVASRDNPAVKQLESAFMATTQLLSALQGRFWQLEAFGGIPPIDATMYTIFQSIVETDHGKDLLPARRYLDIKETAEGLMVFDLISAWYTRGVGARYGFDATMEAMFYASRAIIRMEHVCAAFWMQLSSTSLNAHTTSVAQVIKELIKIEGGMPAVDDTGDYFVLTSSKKGLSSDISQRLQHMGAGLVQQIINQINRGVTKGLPNIKAVGMPETLYINAHYIATVVTPVERKILTILQNFTKRPEMCQLSYDEKHMVYTSGVRQMIYPTGRSSPHEELRNISSTQIDKAITMMRLCKTAEETLMWDTPQTYSVAQQVSPDNPSAEPSTTLPGKFKAEKTWIAPLVVHKDLLQAKEPKSTTLYDDTFEKALLIGGGYENAKVFVGAAPLGNAHAIDHYVTVKKRPVSVELANPMYIAGGTLGLAALLDDTQILDDPVWPRDKESIVFNEHSNLEDTLVRRRYESIAGAPCPDGFLPSKTLY